jgi:hypothetical protein
MRFWALAIVGWLALLLGSDAWAEPALERNAAADAVRAVAAQSRSNYEKIRTWQGVIESQVKSSLNATQVADIPALVSAQPDRKRGRGAVEEGKYTTTFGIDLQENAFYCEKRDQGRVFSNAVDGTPIPYPSQAFWQKSVINSDGYMHVQPNQLGTDRDGRHYQLGIKESSLRREEAGDVGDPRHYFESDARFSWLFLERLVQGLDNGWIREGRYSVELAESDAKRQLIVTTHLARGDETVDYQVAFGLDCAGNPLWHRTIYNGVLEETKEWAYQKIGDVFLPASYQRTHYASDGKSIDASETANISDCKINAAIDQEKFTWKGLGLVEGDRLYDRISGTTYRVMIGKLVPQVDVPPLKDLMQLRPSAATRAAAPQPNPGNSYSGNKNKLEKGSYIYLAAGAIACCAGGAWFVRRRLKRQRQRPQIGDQASGLKK